MKNRLIKRLAALCMATVMVLNMNLANAFAMGTGNAGTESVSVTYQKLDKDDVSAQTFMTNDEVTENENATQHADTDSVRVMIVLEEEAAVSLADGTEEFELNAEVRAYRNELEVCQEELAEQISDEILDGEELDVVWNLTLVANAISANVQYGKIEEIKKMDGVKAVILETMYMPMEADTNNIVAQEMTGAAVVKDEIGYSGAGRRVAVIDTGTDTDHQSFAEGGYEYALSLEAEAAGMTFEEYVESLDLLTVDKIEALLPQLNCYTMMDGDLTAEDLYISSKLPFNFNYVDRNLDVTHDNDTQGEHGSHVAGITTANSYIDGVGLYDFDGDKDFDRDDAQALMDFAICDKPVNNSEFADVNLDGAVTPYDVYVLLTYLEEDVYYASAADTVGVTGVASEAQLITMKVFGVNGGAYTSDYMAATEDAVVLGCDVANLSLGGAWPGFVVEHSGDSQEEIDYINGLMEDISRTDTVMAVAAGNAGNWADNDDAWGLMYTDEGGTYMTSEPGTYHNAFSVASVDNIGLVADSNTVFSSIDGTVSESIRPAEVIGDCNGTWRSLDTTGKGTEYEIVFLGDPGKLFNGEEQTDERIYAGSAEDFEGYDFTGKVVFVARGNGVYFSDKHNFASEAGAAAVVIYNNVPGFINPSITGSEGTAPCGSVSFEQAKTIYNLCTEKNGVFTGKMKIEKKLTVDHGTNVEYMTMSSFSSWGPTGALTIKPEITAPGGTIYSVNGALKDTNGYEWMSGTSMATPHISGLVAIADQYIQDNDILDVAKEASGNDQLRLRTLTQSLLMSTAQPIIDENSGIEYSVRNQGAGLGNILNVIEAESFIMVDGQEDGKVKAELGDGGEDGWTFTFAINNLTEESQTYDLDATIMTTDTVGGRYGDEIHYLTAAEMVALGAEVTYTGSNVTGNAVEVPAMGTATVTVEIQVTEEAVAEMEELGYTNGFYVEGFVYVTPDEGVAHSIPLLGWYGNWTDPSMYDIGSYTDYVFGTLERPSHIYSAAKNAFTWEPKGYGSGLFYTGNIYGGVVGNEIIGDQSYIEARNAFNSLGNSSWDFYAIFPTLIRTVADAKLQVTDADNGEVYFEDDFADFDNWMVPCFYYDGAGQWMDTTTDYGVGIEWDYTDLEGNPLPDGTKVKISLLCAPEYYVNEDGTTNWDAVGAGAELSYRFTVDNTAPDLAETETPLVLNKTNGNASSLSFSVQDNNYVAAVILLNGSASEAIDYYYPDMPENQRGNVVEGSFDLSDYVEKYGNKAVIAICDYAGNETYYAVNLAGEGADYGEFMGFQYNANGGYNTWVSFDADVNKNETEIFLSDEEFVAAEYVNGYVFAQNIKCELYAIPYEDMLASTVDYEATYITTLEYLYQDFAYNYAEGVLLGLNVEEDADGYPTAYINSIALEDDEENWIEAYSENWLVDRGGVYGLTLACDTTGNIYMLGTGYSEEETDEEATAELWVCERTDDQWSPYQMFTKVGDTGLTMDYLQSMTWNHNTGKLYWSRFYPESWMKQESQLLEVNPETAEATLLGTMSNETGCLFVPLSDDKAAEEEFQNVPSIDSSVVGTPVLASTNLSLNVGGSAKLQCSFEPWYTQYKDVTWQSSDESVATVDEHGKVVGIAPGSCVITVTSVQNPTLKAECDVVVAALSLNIEGFFSYTEGGLGNVGNSQFYTYNMEDGVPTMTPGAAITAEADMNFGLKMATSVEARGYIYACEYNNTGMIYKINKITGAVEDVFYPIDGDVMFGLSYSEKTDYFTGIMNFYLYVDQPMTHEVEDEMMDSYDPDNLEWTWHKFDMSQYLAASQGNLVTPEDGHSSIVFCGVTNIDADENAEPYELYKDYLGEGSMSGSAMYTPDTTIVLLDNVGRLWYIDEVTGLTKNEDYNSYTNEDGTANISCDFNGVFAQEYAAETEGEASTYSVFVIREIKETPLFKMFKNGELGITYHFSSIYYVEDEATGNPMFFFSLYDYWNEGATNQLYLYIPGQPTGEMDPNTGEEIYTPDTLYDLGTTGFGNIIATINHAELLDGLPGADGNALGASLPIETTTQYFKGYYR